MRFTSLGSLEVSVIGIGCNNFGRALDQQGSTAVVTAALAEGINFFDTADNYGEGNSQAYLGKALGKRRGEVVIATKFGVPVPGLPGSGGGRPAYVRSATERNLDQLGTDCIDLLQLHRPDPDTPIADTVGAMAEMVAEGKAREIGCSNLDADQLDEAMSEARASGAPLFVSNQMEYSLLFRAPETNRLLSACRQNGVALLPFYPLACGMLTGKAKRDGTHEGRLRMDRYQRYLSDQNFDVVEALADFASHRELSLVEVALGWLLAQPEVPSVTAGATRPEQVRANARAADWSPTNEELEILDSISPVRT